VFPKHYPQDGSDYSGEDPKGEIDGGGLFGRGVVGPCPFFEDLAGTGECVIDLNCWRKVKREGPIKRSCKRKKEEGK
jgi:hypothetical protein